MTGGCACLPKRLFPFKLSTLISTSLCSRQRLRLKCSLVYDFVQNNKIKNCQVRCNYLMPNTTVENNFQLGASSDLYKTYQNKLAASPYTFKSLFMIHKENYFNYCNSVIHTGRHGSSTICLDLSCWCSEYQHENHQPEGSQTQIMI